MICMPLLILSVSKCDFLCITAGIDSVSCIVTTVLISSLHLKYLQIYIALALYASHFSLEMMKVVNLFFL